MPKKPLNIYWLLCLLLLVMLVGFEIVVRESTFELAEAMLSRVGGPIIAHMSFDWTRISEK